MRLLESDKKAIKQTFLEVFKQGTILLFGSRVDDSLRGGDIDTDQLCRSAHLSIFKTSGYNGRKNISIDTDIIKRECRK